VTASAQDRFIAGARAHGNQGDPELVNKAYADLHRALLDLRKGPDAGVAFLFGLLNDDDLSVATWAALYLLPHREDAAKAALRRVARIGVRLLAFNAEITLEEWNAGRLEID